jgi:hypothetical protein
MHTTSSIVANRTAIAKTTFLLGIKFTSFPWEFFSGDNAS